MDPEEWERERQKARGREREGERELPTELCRIKGF